MRRRSERVGLFGMAGLGVLVVLADLLGWLDTIAPGGAIPKITLLVLSSVTVVLLLELDGFRKLDGLDSRLASLSAAVDRGFRHDRHAGLVAVHPRLTDEAFNRYVREAGEITVLNTWIPNLDRLREPLGEALDRRAEVRILLLYPNSLVAPLRDDALKARGVNHLHTSVRAGVRQCLGILEELVSERRRRATHLKVKVYNSLPSVAVYRADEHYLVSVFLHGQLAIDSPQFEIDGADSVLAKQFQRELDTLWGIGFPVNPLTWEQDLDRIRP
ncbi:hypothetical protein BLA60_08505 [Actinophytocola xinjiangensis]|uniref:Uncharacterized protein n=1 Tax=Actinophytocola xinjiangensis TaxID=485602 RepID=A0A7Z1B0E4_9PSEU|nr:hypothetical protein BLA60_08505 [Actinophytocola xinjiangensis]